MMMFASSFLQGPQGLETANYMHRMGQGQQDS